MSHQFFTEFEPYCNSIAHVDLQMRVLGMETPQYSILQAAIGQLGVQWAQEGSGQLSEGATDRSAFGLYLQLNSRPRLLNGMILDPDAIVILPPGVEFCFSCDHANSWLAIRIPAELLLVGDDAAQQASLDSACVVRPGHRQSEKLRAAVLGYLKAVDCSPALTDIQPATSILETQILSIASDLCFRTADFHVQSEERFTTLGIRHARIASAAAELIEDSLAGAVSVMAIAKLLGVSERTLLTAFRSKFGLSPRRFILSMRLNRARTKLRQANYPETRICEIAAEAGFWDFGRFSSKYHRQFGELPSQTIRR